MKFKIRFADQIVGIFIILSIVSLALIIIFLGSSQRWFAKDVPYKTVLPSASGLGKNMAVHFKGFAIGNVKSFQLNEDNNVEVIFTINEEYNDRMKMGSMVELMVSPVGLGNQFLLHTGRGEQLAEGSLVPLVGSAQARELVRQGLAVELFHDDSITVIMNRLNSVLASVDSILLVVDEVIKQNDESTEVGQIVGSLKRTMAGLENIPPTVENLVGDVKPKVEDILLDIRPVIENVNGITDKINNIADQIDDPDSLLYKLLDSDEAFYNHIISSLGSISNILDNLDKIAASQLPQVPGIIMELRAALKSADDVLIALTNNPLLRKGVPDRVESRSGSTNPRDIQF